MLAQIEQLSDEEAQRAPDPERRGRSDERHRLPARAVCRPRSGRSWPRSCVSRAPPRPAERSRSPSSASGAASRGVSDSPDAFWRLISEGGDAVAEVPADRWSADAYYDPDSSRPGRMNTRWGSWLPGSTSSTRPSSAWRPARPRKMDPQQRARARGLLGGARGRRPDPRAAGAGSRTGVFVGTHVNDYAWMTFAGERLDRRLRQHRHRPQHRGQPRLLPVRPARPQPRRRHRLLVLARGRAPRRPGPSPARVRPRPGRRRQPHALAALEPRPLQARDALRRTAAAGPSTRGANGFVRGEGCGAVVLKRLSDALADGDADLGASSAARATNQDGRTNGLTAPNGLAQQAVRARGAGQRRGGAASGRRVEAHGTGTALGDPIEVEALARGPGRRRCRRRTRACSAR